MMALLPPALLHEATRIALGDFAADASLAGMKIFHCDHCQHLIFFENVRCVACGHALAYLPDLEDMGSLEAAGFGHWRCPAPIAAGRSYRLCANYEHENVCNWAVPADDPQALCVSCRLTQVIPDLTQPGNRAAWYRLEIAKRRLVFSLLRLGLPLGRLSAAGHDLSFRFLADDPASGVPPVLTGHDDGVITINLAEADDAEREKRRLAMSEPYRTLLGHFRHEIGHYYWDLLIADGPHLTGFRDRFGDERRDYGEALAVHYAAGAAPDWRERFVSTYAGSHPWEDWAETWAHYLHLIDVLETASACGMSLRPPRADEPALTVDRALAAGRIGSFERLIERWFPLTYALNCLNRSLGQADAYPFVLAPPVIAKLRLVHEVIAAAAARA